MKRSKVNFVVNGLMFLCMSAIAGTGLLIKYKLVTGQERWEIYNESVELYLWGFDRHEWAMIHLIIGYLLLALLVVHIVLHLKVISTVYQKFIETSLMRRIIMILFLSTCTLSISFPFILAPTVRELQQGNCRQKGSCHSSLTRSSSLALPVQSSLRIKGGMTLGDISKAYNVDLDDFKKNLELPTSVSETMRLSWLRKKYHITNDDVMNAILMNQYQLNK